MCLGISVCEQYQHLSFCLDIEACERYRHLSLCLDISARERYKQLMSGYLSMWEISKT